MTIASFLTDLGSIVTAVFGWLTTAVNFIIGQPVILVPMLMFFVVGGVCGLILRLMRG